jgi:ABC-type taurine transport system substrate-binding protein
MIVAKPGIASVAQLKGKTVGVEVGFVDHLLLLHALKSANMKESDVKLKNVKTDETPQALKSGDVDAIGAWCRAASPSSPATTCPVSFTTCSPSTPRAWRSTAQTGSK